MRQVKEKNLNYDINATINFLEKLNNLQELNLCRRLSRYSTVLHLAAINYEPHLLAHYLQELSSDMHSYYNAHQFLVDDVTIRNARLCLIDAVRQILANGLALLGVLAPEMM
jgi:arginyl-tRNA synthetase